MKSGMRVAGFVLTGGQSTRMGRDKALLPVGSQTLCEHVGTVVSCLAEKVYLVGHPERYGGLKFECAADLRPDLGPLSGLETALSMQAAEFNIIASCDLVNIKERWLAALMREVERGAICAVAEDAAGRIQPLCGVYRSDCRQVVSRALSDGRLRAMDLIGVLNVKLVRIGEIILNVNTPEDYGQIVACRS